MGRLVFSYKKGGKRGKEKKRHPSEEAVSRWAGGQPRRRQEGGWAGAEAGQAGGGRRAGRGPEGRRPSPGTSSFHIHTKGTWLRAFISEENLNCGTSGLEGTSALGPALLPCWRMARPIAEPLGPCLLPAEPSPADEGLRAADPAGPSQDLTGSGKPASHAQGPAGRGQRAPVSWVRVSAWPASCPAAPSPGGEQEARAT